MRQNAKIFLDSCLGEGFEEYLIKSEIYKPGSKTVIDTSDIHLGLKLVPRAIMAILIRELVPMATGENKEIRIPSEKNTVLLVTKHERDSLSGQVVQNGKKIAEFMHRSIPGIGLVLLSTLELYELEELNNEKYLSSDIDQKVQKLIDDRLALHDLVERVVDNKLAHKDAVHSMVLSKLSEELAKEKRIVAAMAQAPEPAPPQPKEPLVITMPTKRFPVKEFLQKRKSKKEFSVQMAKGEKASCGDCGHEIYDGNVFASCICYGENFGSKIFLKKNETGISVRFSKDWSEENIEMLLETLRKRNG